MLSQNNEETELGSDCSWMHALTRVLAQKQSNESSRAHSKR